MMFHSVIEKADDLSKDAANRKADRNHIAEIVLANQDDAAEKPILNRNY